MAAFPDTVNPYADTVLGADGKRYPDDAEDIPRVNPRLGGQALRRELAEVWSSLEDAWAAIYA